MADAFENILGQPKVREFLRASVVSERVTQAYLFVGPAGSNKTQAAYALAQALLCPKGPRGPRGGSCGACDRCGRILRRKHPDVRYFAPAGANGYLVEQVREIVADTALSPIQADKKIYILDRVDQLGAGAANAFLKTLEEPADDVVMILLGRTRESVLPTIVSRCQVVPFRHIPASEAAGIVAQNTGADPAQARQAIEACGGSITSAVAFLRAPGSERLAFRTRLFSDLARLGAARRGARLPGGGACRERRLPREVGHPPDRGAQQAPAVGEDLRVSAPDDGHGSLVAARWAHGSLRDAGAGHQHRCARHARRPVLRRRCGGHRRSLLQGGRVRAGAGL